MNILDALAKAAVMIIIGNLAAIVIVQIIGFSCLLWVGWNVLTKKD